MTDYLQFTYPRFQPAQALKSNDLNAIVDYLEKQERLTRVYLIGAGIFYGLKPTVDAIPALNITKGAAVSSQGYLFVLKASGGTDLTTEVPISFNFSIKQTIPKSLFTGQQMDTEQFTVYEFIDSIGLPSGAKALTVKSNDNQVYLDEQTLLKDMVIVLLWGDALAERKSCINSCDGPGADKEIEVRILAMLESDLQDIWLNKPGVPGTNPNGGTWGFPYVKRLHTKRALDTMMSPEHLYDAWKEIIKDATTTDPLALPAVLAGALSNSPDAATIISRLTDLLDGTDNAPYQLQYLYDHLLDLVAAYEELANTQSISILTWFPNESFFPRFVALGTPVVAGQKCRMPFYRVQTPDTDMGQDKIVFMLERLHWLLNPGTVFFPKTQDLPSLSPIRITGSGLKSLPLSRQAIPYYYGKEPGISYSVITARDRWSYEHHNAGRDLAVQGYESATVDASTGGLVTELPPRQSLCFDLGGSDFFRIEGHINQDLRFGVESIEKMRKALHLPFDITCVRLGDGHTTIISGNDQNDPELKIIIDQLVFGTFAKWHPGMEHQGGVPKGGTFILVYKEEETISAQKIRQRRDKLLNPKFTLLENMTKENNQEFADLIKAITLELNTVIQRTIIADFCLPYTCCPKAPTVHYQFTETQAPQTFQPDADFDELKRTYDELAISKNPVPRIKISFENRSDHADKFVWTISPVDMNPGAKFPYPDPIDNIGKGPLELEFNLNIIRKIAVKLVASETGSADFDIANKEIDLCPNEAAIYFTDNKGQGNETKLLWAEGENEKEIFVGIFPPGGERTLNLPVNINIKGNEKLSSTVFRYLLVRSKELAEPVEVTIDYTYPCLGLLSTIKFTVPPPEPQKPDITPKSGDTPPDIPASNAVDDPRIARYLDNIEKIADAKLKTTTAYKRTTAYIAQEAQPDWQKALNEYTSIARAVLGGLGKSGGATDDQFKALYQNLIWRWLDKTLEANPALPVPDLLQETLAELKATLQTQSIDTQALLRAWQPGDIKTNDNAALLDQIQQLLTVPPKA